MVICIRLKTLTRKGNAVSAWDSAWRRQISSLLSQKTKNQFTTNLWPTLQVFSINSSYLLLVLFKISQDVWTLEQLLYNWKWSSGGIWIPGEYLYDVIFSGKQFCFAYFFFWSVWLTNGDTAIFCCRSLGILKLSLRSVVPQQFSKNFSHIALGVHFICPKVKASYLQASYPLGCQRKTSIIMSANTRRQASLRLWTTTEIWTGKLGPS